MKKFWLVAGICLMFILTVKAIDPTSPANQIILQDVVYGGDLTLKSNISAPVDFSFKAESKNYTQTTIIPSGDDSVSVVLDTYQPEQDITYSITALKPFYQIKGTISGYSLKGQALSDTTVEVSWMNYGPSKKYTVEDSVNTTAITVDCSSKKYCFGYFTNLSSPISNEYKVKLSTKTDEQLTTITSNSIPPYTTEVPQLKFLTFHRTDETTLEVCFGDADPPIIPDTPTADQVTFTFTINGTEQHSRRAKDLIKFNNAIHCASFDVTDLSEFTEAFALVGELSVHNQDDLQINIATIFTSFQMPGSKEIPQCSSAAVWNDTVEPIAIVECRENDQLDNLTIVTASAGDPISFLHAAVNKSTKIADDTTYYLDLSANVGSNTPTTFYISKQITVNPPLNGKVQVYSGPDECTLVSPMANPITEQAVVYGGNLTLTFGKPPAGNLYFAVESNGDFDTQTTAVNVSNVKVNLTSYVIDQDISYFIYDSAVASSASATIKGYSLKGQALSDTKVEVSWINCDQNSDYIVEDSTGSTTITVECGTDDYCYGYFTNLSPPIGDAYKAILTPPTEPPLMTTITSMTISPVTKETEIHVQEVHLDWSNDLRMVETEICFQHTSTAHYTNETAFDYEGVIVNNQGEWRRGQGLGMDSERNSCLKPLVLDTESFSVRGEIMVIVLKRSQDGRTVLASGETRMFFHK